MTPALDICRIDSDENPRWLEAMPTLAEAERRAGELAAPTYPRCFIPDQHARQKHIVVGQNYLYLCHRLEK